MASVSRFLTWLAASGATVGAACVDDFDRFAPVDTASGGSGGRTTSTSGTAGAGDGGAGETGGGGGAGGGALDCGSGFDCVASVPVGQYAVLSPVAAVCPSGWGGATIVGDGVDPGCDECTCGAPTGGGCVSAHRRANPGCNGQGDNFNGLVDGDCVDVAAGGDRWVIDAPAATGGSCTPSAPSPLPLFEGTVCTASAGQACGSGRVCVPTASGTFGLACVVRHGDVACPVGWTQKTSLFATVDDSRTCGCGCGAVQGASCTGATVDLFASNDCSGPSLLTMDANGTCTDASAAATNGSFLVTGGVWSGSSCAAQVAPSGAVAFSDPLTLCCAP